jgi:drug/metabolite transporter (DMT)-like permease
VILILVSITMLSWLPANDEPPVTPATDITTADNARLVAPPASERKTLRRSRNLALFSGLVFGVGVLAMGKTSAADGVVPLVSYRVGIAACLLALLLADSGGLRISLRNWRVLLLSGALAASGDAAFIIALQRGPLSIVPAIVALNPGVTAVLARYLTNEKLKRVQVVGIAIGLCGLAVVKL